MCRTRSMFALYSTKSCWALTKDLRRAQPSKPSTNWAESKPILFTTEYTNLSLCTVYFELKINCSSSTCQILLCECCQAWTITYTCVQITSVCLYTWGYVHMHLTQCLFFTVGRTVLVPLFYLLYYSGRKKSTDPVPANFIQAPYFVFHSNRITQHFWKASGFQTACQRPKKVLVALLPFTRRTRRTSGYAWLNPTVSFASFLPFGSVLLHRCHDFSLKTARHVPHPCSRREKMPTKKTPKHFSFIYFWNREKLIKPKPNKAQIKNGIPPVTNSSKLIYKNFEDEKYVVKNKNIIHTTQYISFPI